MGKANHDWIVLNFEKSLKTFLEKEIDLLEVNANERSLAHKLAEHMQVNFSKWNVDCEYNRNLLNIKKDSKHKRVNPDIIVHKRKTDKNILVVEVKKTKKSIYSNEIQKDRERLHEFTSFPFNFSLGLLVVFNIKTPKSFPIIEKYICEKLVDP